MKEKVPFYKENSEPKKTGLKRRLTKVYTQCTAHLPIIHPPMMTGVG